MSTETVKTEIVYYTLKPPEGRHCILLDYRDGRMPIKGVSITSYSQIELYCADGAIEILGTREEPCSNDILRLLRLHHEGLEVFQLRQMTEIDPSDDESDPDYEVAGEQVLKARLLSDE